MKGIKLSTFAARCALFTTCCALLTACSQTDETELSAVPIGFVPTVETQTRGTDFTKDNLTSLGVLAYLTQGGSFNASSSTPNFMYNQEVTKAGGTATWEYTPTKFWPTNSNDKITFFAYAPHNPTGLTVPDITATGYPSFTYEVPSTEAAQTDLLAAIPLMNQSYSDNNGRVSFEMKHTLTKVTIYVKSADNVVGKKITTFSITTAKNGTLTFHTLSGTTDKGFTWSYPTPMVSETFTATATDFAVPNNITAPKQLLATFFLLPYNQGSTFNITYTASGTASSENPPVQNITLTGQPLPACDQWVQGASITYIIAIEKKKIIVTSEIHPTWDDGGEGTITGSAIIIYVNNPDNPEWMEGNFDSVDGTEAP